MSDRLLYADDQDKVRAASPLKRFEIEDSIGHAEENRRDMRLMGVDQLLEFTNILNDRKEAIHWLRMIISNEGLRNRLLDHIRRAVNSYHPPDEEIGWRNQAQSLLDSVQVGTVVVDDSGHPLVVSRRAQEILSQKDGLYLQNDRLVTNTNADTVNLRQAIAAAARGAGVEAAPSATFIALKRRSGQRALVVSVRPVSRTSDDGRLLNCACLIVCDPEAADPVQPDRLRCLYGLTPTEARLAAELANGSPLEEVAKRLKITVGTARVHLKHVFSKTETTRQSELIHLLLNSGLGIFH